MIYVMSDLHGCYDEYIKMLELIKFNDEDTLYILGDICDRGKYSFKILLHMMEHDNIIPIYGNHDLDALGALSKIGLDSNNALNNKEYVLINGLMNNSEYRSYLLWLADGGRETLEEYNNLSNSNKKKVLEYLSDFMYYAEISINNQDYILIHGGLNIIPNDSNKEINSVDDLIYIKLGYNRIYFKDKIIISGHTPTKLIDEKYTGKIIKFKNNHIAIDCGCVFGYGLGCLCLDTMEEYYV